MNCATIEEVIDVKPHPNADKLDLAYVLGWQVVVQKDTVKIGDRVIYVEIDTIFKDAPEFVNFLEQKKWRVRTIRLRGELSEGLILPLSLLPEDVSTEVGTIVAEYINCVKYEKPAPGCQYPRNPNKRYRQSTFPFEIGWHRTDEENLKSHPRMLLELEGKPYYITVKYDGSSMSATWDVEQDKLIICSRNNVVEEEKVSEEGEDDKYAYVRNDFITCAENENLFEIMKHNTRYAIQGECVSPRIQKNAVGVTKPELYVFNLYDKEEKRYCDFLELVGFCAETGLKMCQVVEEGNSFGYTLPQLVDCASHLSYPNKKPVEGVVLRPKTPFFSNVLRSDFSCKIMNPDYKEAE